MLPGLARYAPAGPRHPQEASFFYHDVVLGRAVRVLPGEFYVHDGDGLVVVTTLGSCVAACLHDAAAGVAGMNHFMLPEAVDGVGGGRFGVDAMELLISQMLLRGARHHRLQAKIFGGGRMLRNLTATSIGDRNVAFVRAFLAQERIPLVASDVMQDCPRRIGLFPGSGRVLCKRLPASPDIDFQRAEDRYRDRLSQPPGAEMELFK